MTEWRQLLITVSTQANLLYNLGRITTLQIDIETPLAFENPQ